MKIRMIGGLLLAAAIPLCFSCNKDEEPKPAGISFDNSVEEVIESDGTIKSFHPLVWQSYSGETGATGREYLVKLTLDKALSETAVVSYTIGGTATKNSAAVIGDYDLEGTNLTIEKGATEALIPITLFEDLEFEITEEDSLFETIEITLNSVVSGPVKLGDQVTYKLKINEDDAVWILQWGINGTDSPGDVDMDILFNYDGQIVWGAASDNEFEAVNVPGGFPSGTYGLSYTYFAGTSDDVDFVVGLFNTSGTLNGVKYTYPVDDPLIYSGQYSLNNVNEWSETSPPLIVQTMTKTGINYSNITDITEPSTGSRIGSLSNLKINRSFVSKLKTLENVRGVNKK